MSEKRFKRYLVDGGFWCGDTYIEPIWGIFDEKNSENPISFLEFQGEYKDLCDEIVKELNTLEEENAKMRWILTNYEPKQLDFPPNEKDMKEFINFLYDSNILDKNFIK